jgi:probable HAF family extracellular repeat protein
MKNYRLRNFLLSLVGAVVITLGLSLFTATTATQSASYTIIDLGVVGGQGGANDINNRGQVVGSANGGAFLWENGTLQLLSSPSHYLNYALGINNRGKVVGITSAPIGYGFLWENGKVKYLGGKPNPNDGLQIASSINDRGQIAGTSFIDGGLLWENGTLKGLGTLGGSGGFAIDINNAGQIVGGSRVASGSAYHAFLWDKGTMKDLGTLDGRDSFAGGINNKGQVVGGGIYGIKPDSGHAFLWENNTMKDLGTLGGLVSYAYDINDRGQVVGRALTSSGAKHAFLWSNGTMKDLNTLIPTNSGWELKVAGAINNWGKIVGSGTFNGQEHAFLLTPTWTTH